MNTTTTARVCSHRKARDLAEGWQDGRDMRSMALASTGSIWTGPDWEQRDLLESVQDVISYYESCFYDGMPVADRRGLEMLIRYVERYGPRVSRPWDACNVWDRYRGTAAAPDPLALTVALDAICAEASDHEDAVDRARDALSKCTHEQILTSLRLTMTEPLPRITARRDLVDWLASDADRIATERGASYSTHDN